MTGSSDGELRALQREVQRLLGQCLLRLQAYERLIKAIVTHHEISGPAQSIEKDKAARAADIGRTTLGPLVNQLLESFLTTGENARSPKASPERFEDGLRIRIRMQIGLSADDFARTENGLRELVLLRNNLIHHFLEQHDLGSLEGCRAAEDALIAVSGRIKHHFDDLRQWAEDLERTRLRAAEVINSDAFRDYVVNGSIPWPITEIVRALREAAAELSVDGWAPVSKAIEWVSARYPGELPINYGCRSWKQVLHQSGLFELRNRRTDGQRAAWYRLRSHGFGSK